MPKVNEFDNRYISLPDEDDITIGTGEYSVQLSKIYRAIAEGRGHIYRSMVRATHSVAQSLSALVYTKVGYTNELRDHKEEFNDSRFTAKESGTYLVTASMHWEVQIDGNRTILVLHKNGTDYARLFDGSIGAAASSISQGSTVVTLNAGEYIEIFAYTSNAEVTVAAAAVSYLEIVRIA
jgi:hypothetical protein